MNMIVSFVSGLVLWTFLEYVLHRFVGHARGAKRASKRFRREHLTHHETPDYFTSLPKKLALAIPVLSSLAALGALFFGVEEGTALALGTGTGWVFYERLHRATHVRGPRNAYGAWARRHHLHHHFQAPKANHGVTSPVWDFVFGTLERPQTIAVPRRHARCFAWLLDGDRIATAHAARYRLR